MDFNTVEEILDFAIQGEQEAVDFYSEAAEKVTLRGAQVVLKEFAEEEKSHVEWLTKYKADRAKLDTPAPVPVQDLKRSDYLVELVFKPDMDPVELFRIAMKREAAATKLYTDLGQQSTDPASKELFDMLAKEESKHKNSLETVYDDFMGSQGD
jgi:rubrerythrin